MYIPTTVVIFTNNFEMMIKNINKNKILTVCCPFFFFFCDHHTGVVSWCVVSRVVFLRSILFWNASTFAIVPCSLVQIVYAKHKINQSTPLASKDIGTFNHHWNNQNMSCHSNVTQFMYVKTIILLLQIVSYVQVPYRTRIFSF